MSTANIRSSQPFAGATDFVSSDFSALASHMGACQRSHSRFFRVHSAIESLHAVASPRIVTTSAIFLACGLGLLALA